MTKLLRNGGFTLIELLVVIAIIMILMGMTFVVGPRVMERARLASLANDFSQTRTQLVAYYTRNRETYPPAYGYRVYSLHEPDAGRVFKPYVAEIGFFRNMDIYDRFSTSHDTTGNGRLSLLEFSPVGSMSGPDTYTFIEEIYDGTNLSAEVTQQLASKRPLIYIPVNLSQAAVVKRYYWDLAQTDPHAGWYAERWAQLPNPNSRNDVTALKFPPSRYDDFVLMSVGPGNSTGGILTPPQSFMNDLEANVAKEDWYHVLALRAYFLALRDANDNGMLDFDYNARKQGEGKAESYAIPGLHLLPDGTAGHGPVIYHGGV